MKIFQIALVSLLLFACSTTSKDRYEQLTRKSPGECTQVSALATLPAKELPTGVATEGDLNDEHCLILPDDSRTSYEIYEFTATSTSQSLDVLTFIKARGMGFGGENTIAVPLVTVLKDGRIAPMQMQQGKPTWIRNAWSGDRLKRSFSMSHLVPHEKYRLVITTDNRFMGKELGGYYTFEAAGKVVIGPLGKTELTLK